jgi:HEAT repeat protein
MAAVKPLIELLSDGNVEVRRATVLSLGKLGKGNSKVEESLKKFAADADPLVKLNALIGLASLGHVDESSLPIMLEAINNKEEATAKAAGRVLSQFAAEKPEKVLPGLMGLLDKKEQPGFVNAVRVLSQMKIHALPAAAKISAMYDQVKPQERIEIVDAMTAIDTSGDQAIPVIIKALKEEDPLDRRDALTSLLRYRQKPEMFIDALVGALKDPDLENRLLVIGIMKGLGQNAEKAIPALLAVTADPDTRVRTAAINAVSSFRNVPPESLDTLRKSLKDSDFRVRIAAAGALGRLSNVNVEKVDAALKTAMEQETNDSVKRAIASALETVRKNSQTVAH